MPDPITELRLHHSRDDLQPAPIPAHDVLEGAPVARALQLTCSGDGLSSGLWDCTAGRFRWWYGTDEIVHVLEGEVHVERGDGSLLVLLPGDVAYFEPGESTVWYVPDYVKKFCINRPLPLRYRLRRKLLRKG